MKLYSVVYEFKGVHTNMRLSETIYVVAPDYAQARREAQSILGRKGIDVLCVHHASPVKVKGYNINLEPVVADND